MGELSDPHASSKKSKEYHVLVTGAGPFSNSPVNPSNIIAGGLPDRILLSAESSSISSALDIVIHATPEPWPVSYSWVKEHFPPMLFPPASKASAGDAELDKIVEPLRTLPNYDIALFIGMADGRAFYTLETQAFRDGYRVPDIDGKNAEKDDHWKQQGAPYTLTTSFRTDRVYKYWRDHVPEEIDVRPSNDPGRYLCGYSYYTGLCEYWLHAGKDFTLERPVVFLHVPGEYDDATIKNGVVVAINLIKAMVIDLHQTRESKS